jgi:ATP-dependent DNA helicase DinG
MAGVQGAPLAKYYSNSSLFLASRARAGQYPYWGQAPKFRQGIGLDDLASTFKILKKSFPGYEDRPQQIAMAGEVFACLRHKERLIVEAGTGVGKSFAYLIPVILSKKKTIVSTATMALQDQLVNKDLVLLQKILSQRFSFAILKGKNNYLCLKREREFAALGEPYKRFSKWVATTKTGDRDELPFIPDFWTRVCGDSEDCSNRMCPFYNDCFYYRHYRQLHKKDILVVNHHLLI